MLLLRLLKQEQVVLERSPRFDLYSELILDKRLMGKGGNLVGTEEKLLENEKKFGAFVLDFGPPGVGNYFFFLY